MALLPPNQPFTIHGVPVYEITQHSLRLTRQPTLKPESFPIQLSPNYRQLMTSNHLSNIKYIQNGKIIGIPFSRLINLKKWRKIWTPPFYLNRRQGLIITRCIIGHSFITHYCLFSKDPPPTCSGIANLSQLASRHFPKVDDNIRTLL